MSYHPIRASPVKMSNQEHFPQASDLEDSVVAEKENRSPAGLVFSRLATRKQLKTSSAFHRCLPSASTDSERGRESLRVRGASGSEPRGRSLEVGSVFDE
jgi:hypothetical protein